MTYLEGKVLKIYNAKIEYISPKINSGQYETDHKTYLRLNYYTKKPKSSIVRE